jgi:hypothetical protein
MMWESDYRVMPVDKRENYDGCAKFHTSAILWNI